MHAPAEVDPDFEALLVAHRRHIEAGKRAVVTPVLLALAGSIAGSLLLGIILASSFRSPIWLLVVLPLYALVFRWCWRFHYRLLTIWYRSAIAKGAEPSLLEELGVEAKLFHPRGSFFGRREAPLLARIRGEVGPGRNDHRIT